MTGRSAAHGSTGTTISAPTLPSSSHRVVIGGSAPAEGQLSPKLMAAISSSRKTQDD